MNQNQAKKKKKSLVPLPRNPMIYDSVRFFWNQNHIHYEQEGLE